MIQSALVNKITAFMWLLIRFGVVGLGSIAVYFLVLYLLNGKIADTIILTGVAYVTSAVFNFVLQNYFTFKAKGVGAGRVLKYVLMHLLCMTINSGLMYVLVDVAGNNLFVSQLFVTGIVAGVSFGLSYFVVYTDK